LNPLECLEVISMTRRLAVVALLLLLPFVLSGTQAADSNAFSGPILLLRESQAADAQGRTTLKFLTLLPEGLEYRLLVAHLESKSFSTAKSLDDPAEVDEDGCFSWTWEHPSLSAQDALAIITASWPDGRFIRQVFPFHIE
jgi:hypothetical protein